MGTFFMSNRKFACFPGNMPRRSQQRPFPGGNVRPSGTAPAGTLPCFLIHARCLMRNNNRTIPFTYTCIFYRRRHDPQPHRQGKAAKESERRYHPLPCSPTSPSTWIVFSVHALKSGGFPVL